MSTREENLNKINDELEKLSDEELEKVAGGAVGRLHGINPNTDQASLIPKLDDDNLLVAKSKII